MNIVKNKERKMKTALLIIVLMCLLAVISGCNDTQKQFGKGDLPDHWQEWFGPDNTARLDYVQQQQIERLQATIYGVNGTDENGDTVHKPGLIDKVTALEQRAYGVTVSVPTEGVVESEE